MSVSNQIKVGVVGLGPVGMVLSAHLQEAGLEVAICDLDKTKVGLIKSGGMTLEGEMDKKVFFKNIYNSISDFDAFSPDLIFVSLKTIHLPSAMKEIEKLNNKSMGVICAMNGLGVEKMVSDVIGDSRSLRMVINYAGNQTTANTTKVTFFNPPNYIASIDDSRKSQIDELSVLLGKVGLETKAVSYQELLKQTWEKTILNSSLSALCGVGRMTMKEAMGNANTVALVEQILKEAVKVAAAEKVIFPDDFIQKCLGYLSKTGNHFPSLAVDLMNNRPTEIDYLNGKIVEYGLKHNIPTLVNLTFTNMVKAISDTNSANKASQVRPSSTDVLVNEISPEIEISNSKNYFLGVDLGSAYTKFTVIDDQKKIVFLMSLKTLNRDKIPVTHVIDALKSKYTIAGICATGYGRKHLTDVDVIKTELNCAALGVSFYFPGAKNIIDIGGEDIKIIKCNAENNIENFFLNDKCASGTGSFITEVAERAEIPIKDMTDLAIKSTYALFLQKQK